MLHTSVELTAPSEWMSRTEFLYYSKGSNWIVHINLRTYFHQCFLVLEQQISLQRQMLAD